MTIKYPFIGKQKQFKKVDLVGYAKIENPGKFGNYMSFYFKFQNGDIFHLVDYEYSNYNEIAVNLSLNKPEIEISKLYILKLLITIFIIAGFIIAGIILITLAANGKL